MVLQPRVKAVGGMRLPPEVQLLFWALAVGAPWGLTTAALGLWGPPRCSGAAAVVHLSFVILEASFSSLSPFHSPNWRPLPPVTSH